MNDQSPASPDRSVLPDEHHRWRCGGCGNLTRFDVVRTAKAQEFWHVDLAGASRIEETTTLASTLESVTCRWCGRADAIEIVDRPGSREP